MYSYIKGILAVKTPAYVVVETANGVGYHINTSLHTHERLPAAGTPNCQLHCHLHIKEDAHTLYGFAEIAERDLFVLLISVSGVGPSTAQMMLSSLSPAEIKQAIVAENAALLKSVKGIGVKTAQLIVLQLKDKMSKAQLDLSDVAHLSSSHNNIANEALEALLALGIGKPVAQKAIDRVLKTDTDVQSVEQLIKKVLKAL